MPVFGQDTHASYKESFLNDTSAIVPDPSSRFFDNYLICLIKASIPANQHDWFVTCLEGSINAQNGYKIKARSTLNTYNYLAMAGHQNCSLARMFHPGNAMIVPGSSLRCGFAIESIASY
jgi:hypothetical protein